MSTIRYFIGISLDETSRSKLSSLAEARKTEWQFGKWTHPQDYHITLAFLGDLEPAQAEAVREGLTNHSYAVQPFVLETNVWGTFGPPRKPSILWAGVEPSDSLTALHEHVWQSVEAYGFKPEQRPFRPHITVARRSQGTTASEISSNASLSGSPGLQHM